MSINRDVIDCARSLPRWIQLRFDSQLVPARVAVIGACLFAVFLTLGGQAVAQSRPSPAATPQPPSAPLPPNAPGSVVRPDNEVQQSTQPRTGPEQQRQQTTPNTQGPRPPTPQTPGQPGTGGL